MSYRVFAVQYYYPPPGYPAPGVGCNCGIIDKHGVPLNQCRKAVHQPGSVAQAPKKATHNQLIADKFRKLEIAHKKMAGDLANQARTIAHQTAIIDQQTDALEHLHHDGAAVDAALFGVIGIVIALLSALFKRWSAKPPAPVPSAEEIVGAILRSTSKRS